MTVTTREPAASFTVDEAYAWCERLARAHYENFPVGSRLLPRKTRRDLWAIYAFARTADDFADEPDRGTPEVRLARLADWRARAEAAHRGDLTAATELGGAPGTTRAGDELCGASCRGGAGDGDGASGRADGTDVAVPVFTALAATMAARSLPLEPFTDLLSAFSQDVTTRRYGTWADLLDYCRRSADPVGRLVLMVHGRRDPELFRLSDAVCTALQLTNHWQDLAIDLREKDRLYVPQNDLAAFGVREADLARGILTDAYRRLMRELAARTRALFDAGRPLAARVGPELRLELRVVWHGGRAILERTEAADFDVWRARPSLGARDLAAVLLKACLGR